MSSQATIKRVSSPGVGRHRKKEPIYLAVLFSLRGVLSFILFCANTTFWFGPIMLAAFMKLAVPLGVWRRVWGAILIFFSSSWISVNNFFMMITWRIQWDIRGLEGLSMNEWYLVISNHQTWVDIVVLQKVFNYRIPFLKFFLKKELIWIPLLGVAWWALDFPFMKRYTASFLKKHPHLKGKDIEITRKACEKFKNTPVSIMNFVEGTRFTPEKHNRQNSPFKHLLKPKAGGVGFVLTAMGEHLHRIVNVTIIYPEGDTGFWSFLCGRIHEIQVRIQTLPLTKDLLGDYIKNEAYQARFQAWLNELWREKDRIMEGTNKVN